MSRSAQHDWFLTHHQRARRSATGPSPYSRRLRIEPLEDRRLLALVTVDTLNDTVDFGDGETSLREAIFATNLVGGADTIEFAASLTSGGPATLTLTQGHLAITDALSVSGPGANLLTIDASGNDPTPDVNNGDGSGVFNIDDGNNLVNIDVSISGLTLTGGDVLGSGGAIDSREILTITGSTISGNSASESGGGIISRGDLMVSDSTISGNTTRRSGGGIYSRGESSGGNVTLLRSRISANFAIGTGGGIDFNASFTITNPLALTITDSAISGNSSALLGGGIWSSAAAMTVTGSTINGNLANSSGGGIFHTGTGSLTVTNSRITDNRADADNNFIGDGGGISKSSGTLTVTGSTISGNSAVSGGGIRSPIVIVTGSTINDNTARRFGGGIWFSNLTVTNSTISGNSADRDGGGISQSGSGSITVTNSTIFANQADADNNGSGRGGGISGLAVLNHSIVAGNTLGNGSREDLFATAVFSPTFSLIGDSTGATVNDDGSNLIGTAAAPIDPLLGPLADDGGPTFTHALLADSPAINRGDLTAVAGVGGVPEFDRRGAPFDRVFNGRIDIGAFEYQAASDLNLVVDTLADESDGNYALGDLSLREAILLANTYPSNDTIRFAPALSGGTILLAMGELAITDDTTIEGLGANLLTIDASGNDPTPDENNGDGSRVFRIDDGDFGTIDVSISDLTLTGGDVGFDGGGIFNQENLSIAASTISGNTADGRGGAIGSTGTLMVTDSMLSGNSAGRYGGGISSYRSNLTVTNSTLSGNSVTRSEFRGAGGAIWMDRGSLLVTGSTISNNSAFAGGGIWIAGSLTVTGSTISGNSAAIGTRTFHGFGGGIYSRSYGGVTIADSTISGNSAARDGGGVYNTSGNVTVTNSTISGNTAARDGGGMKSYGTLSIMNSRIDGNMAVGDGGGIRKTGNGIFSLTTSTVRGNAASEGGGIYNGSAYNPTTGLMTAIGSTITGNTAALGAGIFNRGGTLTLDSCAVVTNTATGSGGAIFSRGSGAVNVINSTISGNTAGGSAGGLYLFGTGSTTFALRHSTIASNTAGGLGGGVFFVSSVLSLDHTILATNTGMIGADLSSAAGSVATARFSLIGTNVGSTFVEAPVGSPDANGNVIGGPIHGLIDPRLTVLADHGGPTPTRALLSTSPAIDAGDTSSVGSFPALDQRGAPFARIAGGRIDIGAYERQSLLSQSFVVDTLADESDGDYSPGDTSIREAIGLANGSVGADTIAFAAELTAGEPAIIRLERGELRIVDSVTISGAGAELLTIDASGNDPTPDSTFQDGDSTNDRDGSRVFNINEGIDGNLLNVSISGLTLTGGDASPGGAIYSRETLNIASCTISGNSASNGGGVAAAGSLTITGSRVEGNSASNIAGITTLSTLTLIDSVVINNLGVGIQSARGDIIRSTISGNLGTGLNASGNIGNVVTVIDSTISNNSGGGISSYRATLKVSGSTITGNTTPSNGGGINVRYTAVGVGDLTLENSTVSGNSASGSGGGIYSRNVTVTNSTISGNSAGSSGGIRGIIVTVSNSTISGNLAAGGGGGIRTYASAALSGTIVAGNLVAGSSNDISGTVASSSAYNLIGVNTGVTGISNGTNGNQIGTAAAPINPLLGPLADNGGPTMTHALLAGSPAIDAGSGGGGFDQRGAPFTRVFDGDGNGVAQSDIGAFELQPIPAALFGDYSGDGNVDAADYIVWRKFVGSNVTPYSGADGSGNGIVDQNDNGVWRARFGHSPPPPAAMGSEAGFAEVQPPALATSSTAAQIGQGEVATSDGSLSVQMVAELRGEENSVGGQVKRFSEAVEPRASRGELFAPRSLLRIPSRPSNRASFSASPALAASRRDHAIVAWMASHRDVTRQVEEPVAIDAWKNDDAGKTDETYMGSIDQVFALLASD